MQNQKGFTLIEMLVVTAILGMLSVMIIPRYGTRIEESKIATTQITMQLTADALDIFAFDTGAYPEELIDLLEDPDVPNWQGPYFRWMKMPKDAWEQLFEYKSPGDENPDYDLWSIGADEESETNDDITNWD